MPARWRRCSTWTPRSSGRCSRRSTRKKQALLDSNEKAIALGYDYAQEHFACPLPIHLEKMDATKDSILIDGNTAAALGCVYAGATVGAWYPITPATSLMEAFKGFCQKYRRDPETKKNRFAILQAEDELAAIGMVIGASWAGARAFTPTAGPGISLMNEFIGLAYYAEVPAVIFDVQRTGPVDRHADAHAAGRPDAVRLRLARRHAAHLPLPGGPARGLRDGGQRLRPGRALPDAGVRAERPRHRHERLDGAEADLGRQLSADRGKVLSAEELEEAKNFYRYLDVDGDGIPQRTLPGVHPKGAYFTRGSGHNKYGAYTEDADEYSEVLDRIERKIQSAARAVPAPIVQDDARARRWGWSPSAAATPRASRRSTCWRKDGIALDYMRVRGLPVRRRGAGVPRAARGRRSSSSRTATRSCAAC